LSLLTTILAFLFAVGLLVTIHELGHYWAARAFNVKILRFSIGFGKELWTRKRGADQTEWVIAALPLGGYVKMADERDDSVAPEDVARAFNTQAIWKRMIIIAAGPMANFVLAALLYWVVFVAGQPGLIPLVAQPVANTPAATAGFQEMDRIVSINERTVKTWNEARLILLDHASAREVARIGVETKSGAVATRELQTASLQTTDLDRDYAGALGLIAYRLPIAPVVDVVSPNGAASRGGLKPGDRIVAVNGKSIREWGELVAEIVKSPDTPIKLVVESRGETFDATVTPERVQEGGRAFGRIGVQPRISAADRAASEQLFTLVRYGVLESIPKAIGKVWEMSVFSLKMMWRMITGDISWKNLSGPITIADYAGQSAKMGWLPFVLFLALISVSIGVLNLLPIPVLDGGQLLYHIAELIKGSPVSAQALEIGQRIGLVLLLCLTAFAFYNDIHRLLAG
jgi:regulator of sigma E protease